MADALLEQPIVISLTRARTYRVNGAPRLDRSTAPEAAGHPDELRSRPTPYERLMNDIERVRDEAMRLGNDPHEIEEDGLEVPFAGGMLQISGAALALSQMPSDVPGEDTADSAGPATTDEQDDALDDTETETDSSLDGGIVAPDLGERVL